MGVEKQLIEEEKTSFCFGNKSHLKMFGKHSLDLEKQFTFYASYHNAPMNILIHLLCIPTLLATGLVLFQYCPEIIANIEAIKILPGGQYLKINAALVIALIYILCYIVMEPFAGTLGALLVYYLTTQSAKLVALDTHINEIPIWKIALAIHVVCWIPQFIGHGVFEGRAPALIDSWDQAFLTAPLFVLLEVMFFFGYRKEFHDRIMVQVEKNIKEFKTKQN